MLLNCLECFFALNKPQAFLLVLSAAEGGKNNLNTIDGLGSCPSNRPFKFMKCLSRGGMSRILFVWELGAHFGHLSRDIPVAQRLCEEGHQVRFAVRDTRAAAGEMGGGGLC